MRSRPSLADGAQEMLKLLPDAFRLYPHPDETRDPSPQEFSAYLMKYPQYATAHYDLAALEFASNRQSVVGLSPEMQKLAGSLIAIKFSEQELIAIANH